MKQHDDFALPQKVNSLELKAALFAAGALDVVVGEPVTWTRVAVDGTESFETEPGKVQVLLPDGADRDEFAALIAAHNPQKSDVEARDDAERGKRSAMKAELRAYMLEFLQDPELVGMLKQALAK